jgi:glutamyl-tRNA synthetase
VRPSIARSSRFQAPTSREAPVSKHQPAQGLVCNLVFGISPELECWSLVLSIRHASIRAPFVNSTISKIYRGRIAPSPTGYLHIGHARTFWIAQERARASGGVLVLRNEDIDSTRFKMEFVDATIEDLKWFGFQWQEGPDVGGPFCPYNQSERLQSYRDGLNTLIDGGFVYPCTCSRKDIRSAARAPHAEDDAEPIYPGTCRPKSDKWRVTSDEITQSSPLITHHSSRRFAWRFRVPDGEAISFIDGNFGPQQFIAGKDFGDFVVWRQDDVPAYQLACVVDDAAMQITEVVRGADLLLSTARQLLLYRALGLQTPSFFHCELMKDESGTRLAKRHDALSLHSLRLRGGTPAGLRSNWQVQFPQH